MSRGARGDRANRDVSPSLRGRHAASSVSNVVAGSSASGAPRTIAQPRGPARWRRPRADRVAARRRGRGTNRRPGSCPRHCWRRQHSVRAITRAHVRPLRGPPSARHDCQVRHAAGYPMSSGVRAVRRGCARCDSRSVRRGSDEDPRNLGPLAIGPSHIGGRSDGATETHFKPRAPPGTFARLLSGTRPAGARRARRRRRAKMA
jgi:hypothetical protein